MKRFGRGTSTGMYRDFLYNLYIPAMEAKGVTPVLVTSMPRTSGGLYKESEQKPNGFAPDSPGIMREAALANSNVKLVDLYKGSKKYIDDIGAKETTYIYQSLEAGETPGKTNSGSYANGHPDNKIDGTHYKEAAAKQWARIIAQEIYAQSEDNKLGILADSLSDGVKAACADGDWTAHVFPEMAKDVSTVGGTSQGDNAYYRNQIEKMLQLGIMAKDSSGSFRPKAEMTVGSFAKSLTKAWSLDESVLSSYTSSIDDTNPTDKPAEETAKPTDETAKPTDKPTEETAKPTDKPAEETAKPTDETAKPTTPSEVDAVKAVAKYDGSGRLTSIELDKNYKYNGSVEPVAEAKVFVWDNLKDMRPLCGPITEDAKLSLSEAGDSFVVSSSYAEGAVIAADTVLMDDANVKVTSVGNNVTVKNSGVDIRLDADYDGTITPRANCAALKVSPKVDGKITINAKINAGKSLKCSDGINAQEYPNSTGANGTFDVSFDLKAGTDYVIYSKGGTAVLYSFTYTDISNIPTPTPVPTKDPNATPEPEVVKNTAIDKDAVLTREAMAAVIYDAYEAKFGRNSDGSWNKPVYMTNYNGTNLSPDDPNYDPNLTGTSSQYYPLVGWGALTDVNDFHTSLYGKAKEVYNLGLMRSEKGIERGKMINGTEMEPLKAVTREKAAKELYFLYALAQDKDTENQVLPEGNMAFTLTEEIAVPDTSKNSYPSSDVDPDTTPRPGATSVPEATSTPEPTLNPDGLPADEAWTSNDADLVAAVSAAADKEAFGPVNGISGYGSWVMHNINAEYTHTNGVKYTFTTGFQAGSGNAERKSFIFTPKEACIVTVAYAASAGRPVYIYQGSTLLASGEEGLSGTQAATITADIEYPSAGDVIVYGGSSNKDIFGIFADYYDPNVVVNRKLSGNISYDGAQTGLRVVFRDTKDGVGYTVDAVNGAYSTEVRQNRDYDILVIDAEGNESDKVAVTMDTNSVSVAKMDKTHNIKLVDIGMMKVSGDVVVHDVNNDGSSLDLSKVQLTFTATDDAKYTYTTGIADKKLSVDLMPNHEYTVTASNIDGYSLSALSGTYVMAAGDMAPFKNILLTENVSDVPFKPQITVGADKEYARINDAITAIKAMKDRPEGEEGRVTVLIDPGTYIEQVIVDPNYVTLKAADDTNKPEIQWYYGVGYLYYSSAGNQYYSEDWAVQKTKKGTVTRWGAACRITGQYCNAESIIFRNTLNCEVTEAEKADGVAPALNNEYSDVNGKPDRLVTGYNARAKAATERAAAIALDGGYTELYKCEFISSQDTFYTNKTAYAKECYIEGATDYIFGGNSMLFEDCTLAWHGYADQAIGGYITACKTSGPSDGTPNEGTNGYMFKNSTVVNSKYYPDNLFAAGSWGRNWGGADCQVVFDGVKLEGVDVPGAWVKMGGDLSTSILFVNDVTDKNGAKVDTSGTAFNPNGIMESKGYTMMSDTDYFGGTWVPAHYDKVIELSEYTSTWFFGKSNGAAEYALQGADNGEADITAVSNNPTAQILHVNAINGKLNNASRTDEWAQWNAGTVLTVPVVNGSTIQLSTYQSAGQAKINGEVVSGDKQYTYYGTASTVDIESVNGGYISSVKVISPANPSTEIPTPKPEVTVTGTITGLDAADASVVKVIISTNGVLEALDVADGTFTTTVSDGSEPTVLGIFGGASAYSIPKDTVLSYDNAQPAIVAAKVEAQTKYGSTTYALGDGSVIPKLGISYANFVTQDGIVTFRNVKYHNDHGVSNANGTLSVNVKLPAGKSTISLNGCAYAGDTTVITAPSGVTPVSANLKTESDNSPIDFTYDGEATDLTFTISGGAIYLHALTVTTTNENANAEDAKDVQDYGTADNNPCFMLDKILTGVDEDDNTVYTLVGYRNGGQVKYTTKKNTTLAKLAGAFTGEGSRRYNTTKLWDAVDGMASEGKPLYPSAKTMADIVEQGDILGVSGSGEIFILMVDASELAKQVRDKAFEDIAYEGASSSRDSLYVGQVQDSDLGENAAMTVSGRRLLFDASNAMDTAVVNEAGTVLFSTEDVSTIADIIDFNSDTTTGDYAFARYAAKGVLQEVFIYRFD